MMAAGLSWLHAAGADTAKDHRIHRPKFVDVETTMRSPLTRVDDHSPLLPLTEKTC